MITLKSINENMNNPSFWKSPEIVTLEINPEANFMTSGNVDKTAEYEYDDECVYNNGIWK